MISRWMGRLATAAALLLLGMAPIVATADEPAHVAGTWKVTWEGDAGPETVTVTFTQEGEKLTGTYTDPGENTSPVTGEVKGRAIEFAVDVESEDGEYTLTFRGTVEGDSMAGTMTRNGEDFFDWTATRTG